MPKRRRGVVEPQGRWIGRDGVVAQDDTEEALELCRTFFQTGDTDTQRLVSQLEMIKHPVCVGRVVQYLERLRGVVEAQLCPLVEYADNMREQWDVHVDVATVESQLAQAVWERGLSKISLLLL